MRGYLNGVRGFGRRNDCRNRLDEIVSLDLGDSSHSSASREIVEEERKAYRFERELNRRVRTRIK